MDQQATATIDVDNLSLNAVEEELHQFEEKHSSVTRTLQMVVYPAMVAFIILAAYGFYLVQSLTTDVHRLADSIPKMYESVQAMNQSVHHNMTTISHVMTDMNTQIAKMTQSTQQMSTNMGDMTNSTQTMVNNIQQMNTSTQNIAASAYNMQRDMWTMNKNISGPMKMFSMFTPFGNDKTTPYVVPPPIMASYNNMGYYHPIPMYTPTPTIATETKVATPMIQTPIDKTNNAPTQPTTSVSQPTTNASDSQNTRVLSQ
jgi:uncharacterized protein YoxC